MKQKKMNKKYERKTDSILMIRNKIKSFAVISFSSCAQKRNPQLIYSIRDDDDTFYMLLHST